MNWTPYYIVFALAFLVIGYGLYRRAAWMWYAGWVLLYLFSGKLCTYFFYSLATADTGLALAGSLVFLAGGAVLWVPVAIWWSRKKHLFGRGSGGSLPPASNAAPDEKRNP